MAIKLLKKPAIIKKEVAPAPEKKERKKSGNKLPSDSYKPEFDPKDMEVDENRKFVLSVIRGGEDGLPMCDIRQFQTTEVYTGFTKKGINFPVELLPDLIEHLQEIYNECSERELL